MKQSWIIGMLALINFLVGTSQFIIVGILDKIAASMGITIEMAGQLVTAFALASAFRSPPFVILVSHPQKNEQLTAALVTLLVGIFILLVTNSFWWMMLSRAILGIGSGAFIAISYAIAASLAGNNGRAVAMSYISMRFSASLTIPLLHGLQGDDGRAYR